MLRHGHFGLVVMRERVELAAGRFEIKSAPLTGTEVTVWLPITSTRSHRGSVKGLPVSHLSPRRRP